MHLADPPDLERLMELTEYVHAERAISCVIAGTVDVTADVRAATLAEAVRRLRPPSTGSSVTPLPWPPERPLATSDVGVRHLLAR